MTADLKLLSDLPLGVIARAQQGARLFQVIRSEGFGSAPDPSALPRGLQPRVDPLAQEVALKFRQRREQMERQLAGGRRRIDVLGEGMQFNTSLVEQHRGVDELTERTRQAVELPDNDNIPLPRVIQEAHQFRSIRCGPGGFLLIDAAALGAFERIELEMGFLRIRRNAGVANSHRCKNQEERVILHPSFCTIVVQLILDGWGQEQRVWPLWCTNQG